MTESEKQFEAAIVRVEAACETIKDAARRRDWDQVDVWYLCAMLYDAKRIDDAEPLKGRGKGLLNVRRSVFTFSNAGKPGAGPVS